jgi:uncharacterized protein (TIGR00369 family)
VSETKGPWRAEDWEIWDKDDPFEAINGAIYRNIHFQPDGMELTRVGFRIEKKNCNMLGTAHGGLIAALMDISMGRNAWSVAERPAPTISINVDFVRAAQVGEWLESRCRVVRKARRFVFCDGLLLGDKGVIARGSGVFAIPDAPSQ